MVEHSLDKAATRVRFSIRLPFSGLLAELVDAAVPKTAASCVSVRVRQGPPSLERKAGVAQWRQQQFCKLPEKSHASSSLASCSNFGLCSSTAEHPIRNRTIGVRLSTQAPMFSHASSGGMPSTWPNKSNVASRRKRVILTNAVKDCARTCVSKGFYVHGRMASAELRKHAAIPTRLLLPKQKGL